jgi:hypothetical protein
MSTNKTDVWNRVLIELGVRTVGNIESDTSKEAKVGNTLYQPTLDYLLREVNPGFARQEVTLAVVTGATSVEYDYVYAQPADCLLIKNVYKALSKSDPVPYEKRSNDTKSAVEILTDEEDAVLVYTATIDNVNIMDKSFVDALVALLALKSVKTLTGDSTRKTELRQDYEFALSRTSGSDLSELEDKAETTSPAETARGC